MSRKILISIVMALALSGVPFDGIAQSIKVGAVVPLTGRYAALGGQVKTGYEIAVHQINAAGGVPVDGKKLQIELTMLDDESDPTKTVARLETLATQGVVAYLGGAGSDLHAAAASIGDKNKIPYLGVAFAFHGIHKQGLRYLFSPFPKSPDLTTETFVFLDAMTPAAPEAAQSGALSRTDGLGKRNGISLGKHRQEAWLPDRRQRRIRAGL